MLRSLILLSSLFVAVAQAADIDLVARLSQGWLEERFRRYDRNRDGKLQADERAPIQGVMEGADQDNDGAVTLPELQAHFRSGSGQALQHLARTALSRITPEEVERRFSKLDRNGDGQLDEGEVAGIRWLLKLDSDGNGNLTLEEARTFFASLSRPAEETRPPVTPVVPEPESPTQASPRQAPGRIKPSEHGVGMRIEDRAVTLLDGSRSRLHELLRGEAAVIALNSPTCPVSKRYLPSLAKLQSELKPRNVSLLLVVPPGVDSPDSVREHLASAGIDAACIRDSDGTLSAALGALATTDAFVLDRAHTIAYRGALDDQYGLGYSLDAPRRRYVSEAIDAILTGHLPEVQATEAPGCILDLNAPAPSGVEITYHNRISRILQSNCVECHRTGGVAPFALEQIDQVHAKAGMIRRMVERRLMPPWFAESTGSPMHMVWANDRSLGEKDRTDLLAWLSSGRPEGNPADAPVARTWPTQWRIGEPDAVFQIPKPIAIKASGVMSYQLATVETKLTESKWIQAVEIQPTAREVVHHVLVYVTEHGQPLRRRVTEGDGSGGYFAAYVPGNDHVIYPAGFAKPLPKGASLVFQIHYTPNGTATEDQLRLGVRFASAPPQHVVQVVGISNHKLSIPPGADNHPVTATIPVPKSAIILGFMPHMHLRGKAFRYDLITPEGTEKTLLNIPRYDFNWQLAYRFADPLLIKAGSKLRATGWFDNSAGNPANPDPSKTVHWGAQTYDEMMLGYVEYYLPGPVPVIPDSAG